MQFFVSICPYVEKINYILFFFLSGCDGTLQGSAERFRNLMHKKSCRGLAIREHNPSTVCINISVSLVHLTRFPILHIWINNWFIHCFKPQPLRMVCTSSNGKILTQALSNSACDFFPCFVLKTTYKQEPLVTRISARSGAVSAWRFKATFTLMVLWPLVLVITVPALCLIFTLNCLLTPRDNWVIGTPLWLSDKSMYIVQVLRHLMWRFCSILLPSTTKYLIVQYIHVPNVDKINASYSYTRENMLLA